MKLLFIFALWTGAWLLSYFSGYIKAKNDIAGSVLKFSETQMKKVDSSPGSPTEEYMHYKTMNEVMDFFRSALFGNGLGDQVIQAFGLQNVVAFFEKRRKAKKDTKFDKLMRKTFSSPSKKETEAK